MADTNKVALAVAKETVAGTKETTNYLNVPFNSSSDLGLTPEYVQSVQINTDRAPGENLQVGQSVEGGFDLDLQATSNPAQTGGGPIADMYGAAIGSDVPVDNTAIYDFENSSITVATNSLTGTTTDAFDALPSGSLIYIKDENGLTGVCEAASVSAATDTITTRGCPDFTGTATTSVYAGDMHTSGTDDVSYSLHREYQDVTQHEYFQGMRVNTATLSASAESIVTSNFGFMGTNHQYAQTNTAAKAATQPAYDGAMTSASVNVLVGPVGGSAFSLGTNGNFVTDLTLDIAANMRERNALGQITPVGIGQGTIEVTGSLTCYFADASLVDLVLAGTISSIGISVDCGTTAYGFFIPAAVFTQGSPAVSGQNEDVLVELAFTAQRSNNATGASVISMASFPYQYV